MSSDRLRRVQELFEAACTRPAVERRAFLDEACGGDEELLRQVNALVLADAQTDAMLDAPVCSPPPEAEAAAELATGTVLDQYEVEGLIGSGGYGSVYRARHVVIHKAAAIKVLHPEHAHSAALDRRFVAEARAVNEIGHPNIIDIFGFGETDDGRLYYIMEYIDAPSLEQVIRERGRIPLASALPILRGLAAALDAAHAVGIVHRDLKPANVIVREGDSDAWIPKLLDFGIAKLAHGDVPAAERTESGQMIGTPAYMAPEQIRGKSVSGRTDVYAFGVLAYRMLTGTLPFQGDSAFDVLSAHVERPPRPPTELVPELGPVVDRALLAMLAKDPDDRPATLADAVAPLMVAGRGTVDPVLSRSPWIGRALGLIGLVAVAAVAWQVSVRTGGNAGDPTTTTTTPAIEALASDPVEAGAAAENPRAAAAHVVTTDVKLEVEGTPAGTTVIGPDRRVLGTTPGPVVLPAGSAPLELTFEHADGRRQSHTITPDRDRAIELTWAAQPSRAHKPKKKRLHRDLETPFDK